MSDKQLCNQSLDKLLKKNSTLKGLCDTCNLPYNDVKNGLGEFSNMADDELGDANDVSKAAKDKCNGKLKEVDDLIDAAKDGAGDPSTIAKCLANLGGAGDLSLGQLDLGLMGLGLLNELLNFGFFESLLDNLLASGLALLNSLIPIGLIDDLLGLAQCLAGCPNAKGLNLVSPTDIESTLNGVGLGLDGKTDVNVLDDVAKEINAGTGLSDKKKEYLTMLGNTQKEMTDSIKAKKKETADLGKIKLSDELKQQTSDYGKMSGQQLVSDAKDTIKSWF